MTFTKVVLTLLLFTVCLSPSCAGRGNRLESWETTNKSFRVRITAYDERGVYLHGTYYVFESARAGSDAWREFMTLRHDDRPEIPKDQVRFVNDNVGYVFMGWMFAVTTDGGNTWSIWDATRDVPDWQWSKYGVIRDVRLELDGSGKMVLEPVDDANRKVPEFRTNDFGRHWRAD